MKRLGAGLGAALLVALSGPGLPHAAAQTPLVPGGLASPPGIYALGPDLVQNGGFETNDGTRPSGWITDSAWAVDGNAPRSGSWSLRLTDAPSVPFAQIARQNFTLRRGIYKLSGWIRTQDLGTNAAGSGVRLNLDYSAGGTLMRGLTPIVSGTTDWTYFETTNIVVPEDRAATLRLEAFKEPSGSAWFDDVRLEEQLPAPLEIFVLYPNYRGMLFEGQPSTIRIDVTVTPPGAQLEPYDVVATLRDGAAVITERTYAASAMLVAELDGTGLEEGRLYDVEVSLVERSGGQRVYSAPVYRVSRVPASARATMNVGFDDKNRILLRGTPRFVLGVYDSGIGYNTTDSFWEQTLWAPMGSRWMDGLRINMYLNYQFGHAPTAAMNALVTNLQRHGVMYLQTGNCFQASPASSLNFQIDASDDYVRTLGAQAGSAGYYTVDECTASLIPDVFAQYSRLRSLDADSMAFGTLFGVPPDVFLWSDSVDVLSTDPYPLSGPEPAGGYPHRLVADWTAVSREAVLNARPFMTVLQFFKLTESGRWPTLGEMRSHAYMAIVEGARGLFWWSLGANALSDVCPGWCDEKIGYLTNLKTLVSELADLEGALLADDAPALLTANSQPVAIQTKIKTAGEKGYVFAYNRTGSPVTTTLAWYRTPGTITVNAEGRTLAPIGNEFTDTFGPYEAHVYVIDPPPPPVNPVPVASTLSPSSAPAGGPPFTLTVSGSNFITSSVVRWNGSDRVTTYVSGTELQSAITAGDIAAAGTASVTVFTPGPGGGVSEALTFTMTPPASGTTFPIVQASSIGISAASASAAHTVGMPGGVVSGNLLVSCVAGDGLITAFSWPAGWAELSDVDQGAVVLSCAYKVSTGTEGASITVTSTGSDRSKYFSYRISGQHGSTAPQAAITATGNSANPDPPALTPSWGADNTLWLAVVGLANSLNLTDAPDNYTNCQQTAATLSKDPTIGVCRRTFSASREDPTTFTQHLSGSWAALTIAIRPGSGTGGGNPLPVASALSPPSRSAGGPPFALTVSGSNFVPNSTVRWNGSNRATTYVSGTRLEAAIAAADIAASGTAAVTVFTPAPDGGLSEALAFTITPAASGGAFPAVESTSVGISAAVASTSHTVTMPSGVVSGNLLLACIAGDGLITAFSWPTGWIELSDVDQGAVVLSCAYKVATGAEGASIAVASTGSDRSDYLSYRISGQHASSAPEASTPSTGNSANPNPPSLMPSWGADNTLWLAVVGLANSLNLTDMPDSYTNCQQTTATLSKDPTIGVCRRHLNASSDDPATFTQHLSGSWAALTIAVRPGPP